MKAPKKPIQITYGRIQMEPVKGENKWRLIKPWRVSVAGKDYLIPAGFEWDGASLPNWSWGLMRSHPVDKIHLAPGLFHDAVYAGVIKGLKRGEADKIYRVWLIYEGEAKWKANIEWTAIFFCGWRYYHPSMDIDLT